MVDVPGESGASGAGELAVGELAVGDLVEVSVGAVAHGGHFIARHEGRVIFVRHALPGERVNVRITEGGGGDSFLRGDAVAVHDPSPARVEAPCVYAGPGQCGGCDFQHVELAEQRVLKAEIVRDVFSRIGRISLADRGIDVVVSPVPGDRDGLGWRTRVEFAAGPQGRPGLHVHRSHEVVPVERCAIAADGVNEALTSIVAGAQPVASGWDLVAPSDGGVVTVPLPLEGPVPDVTETVVSHDNSQQRDWRESFEVSARGFWQVHPGAAGVFVDTVLEMLDPQPGERAMDLYAGVGLFAAALADRVGPTGQVIAIEADAGAAANAAANLAGRQGVAYVQARVDDAFGVPRAAKKGPQRRRSGPRKPSRHALVPSSADIVVLDPPRTGAGRTVVEAIAALGPRAIAYVACDPAALARDTATFEANGFQLTQLKAYDAFPMTHHLECIAMFARG